MAAISAFFLALAYSQLLIFNYVILIARPDLRVSFWTLLTFPFYKVAITILCRQYALMENALSYSVSIKPKTIEYRLTKQAEELNGLRDIPPVPEQLRHPNWWHVWHVDAVEHRRPTQACEQSGALQYIPRFICITVQWECEHHLEANSTRLNQSIPHAMLAHLLFLQLDKECSQLAIRLEEYAKIRARMKLVIMEMLKTPLQRYESLLETHLATWEQTNLAGSSQSILSNVSAQDYPVANRQALMAVLSELTKLGNPQEHDAWALVRKDLELALAVWNQAANSSRPKMQCA